MNISDHSPARSLFTRIFTHYRIWVWGGITASILICFAISWLHYHQRSLLVQATAELATIRQARIDLAKGFLHVSLASDTAAPFNRDQGVALLNQAIATLEKGIESVSSHPAQPEALTDFQNTARLFREQLVEWSNATERNATIETVLRSVFYDLERKADRIDSQVQQELHQHYTRLDQVFILTIAVAALLFSGFSCAIFVAGRAQEKNTAALREQEQHFRSYFERVMVGMAATSPAKGWLEVNPELLDILGYTAAELSGKTWAELTHPDDLAAEVAQFEQLLAGMLDSYSMEKRFIRSNGEIVWTVMAVQAVRNPDRSVNYCVAIIKDISDRKRDEETLKRSEENYRLLFHSNPLPMWIYDLETLAFLEVNNAAVEHYGYTRAEFLNMTIKDIRPADDLPRLLENVLHVNEGLDHAGSWRHLKQDGSVIDVEITSHTLAFEGRRAELVLSYDVSDRKKAEKERAKLEAQLLQSQKMESVGRLAGGVAHDFNNMLTVILGYAEMIKMQMPDDNPLKKKVIGIETAAVRSRDITRQLLAFSRQQIIEPRPLDLNGQIVETCQTLARLIGEDIDLRFVPADGLWMVSFDPSQFDQIIVNLAVNARDAMPDGGKLTIETANVAFDESYCREHLAFTPGDYVQLAVSDDGIGMDQETMTHIFEPFFTTKEIGKGTGLGLATVYGIIKQNAGFINVYSEPGQGTTFRIYIPRYGGVDEQIKKVPEERLTSASGTILLVEDDDMVRELTTSMLSAIGYEVIVAETPFAALALCEKDDAQIDLILSDVVMPGMKGTELRDRIEVIRPGIKFLFMSGYTSDVIVHHGVLDEGVNFIQKPFSMRDLAQKTRNIIAED